VETLGTGVTSTVQGVTGGALSPLGVSAGTTATAGTTTTAGAGTTATAGPGGLLAPVTGTVNNTVNTLTGALNLSR